MNKRKAFLLLALFILPCLGALGQQVLYRDEFSGKDGTRPANWTVFNAPNQDFWYLDGGQFSTGNGDEIIDGYSYAVVQASGSDAWRNYTVRCSAWMTQRNGKTIIVGRWKDANNHYEGFLECYEGNRSVAIDRIKDGKRTELKRVTERADSVKIAPLERGTSPADSRQFALTFFEDQISFSYDGKTYILIKDNEFKSGTAGIGHWFNFNLFDNFVVEEAKSAVAAAVEVAAATPAPPVPVESRPSAPSLGQPSIYRILVASNLNQTQANALKKRLDDSGYVAVDVSPKGSSFEVYLGAFTDEARARDARQNLEREGYTPGTIIGVASFAPSAPATAEPTPPPSAPPAQKAFRVLVNLFPTQDEASKLKQALENDGYVAVDVVKEANQFNVYVGTFKLQEQASQFCSILQQDGYPFARVAETAKEAVTVAVARPPSMRPAAQATPAAVIPSEVKEKPEWKALTPEQRAQVEEIVKTERTVTSGDAYVEELKRLKDMIDQLNKNQKDIFNTIRRQEEDRRQKEIAVVRLFDQVAEAMDARNWDKAQEYLNEVKKVDPNNPKIEWKERVLSGLREGAPVEPKEFFAVTREQDIQAAKKGATENESRADIDGAIAQWQIVKNLADVKSLASKEAAENIGRLRGIKDKKLRDEEIRRERQEMATYAIGGVVVLVLLVVIVMFARARRRDRELLKQVQEIALKPLLELEEGRLPRELTERAGVREEAPEEALATEKPEAKPAPPPPRKKIKLPRRKKEEVTAAPESSLYGGDLIITPEEPRAEDIFADEEISAGTAKASAEAPEIAEPTLGQPRPPRPQYAFVGDHTPIPTSDIESAAEGPTREMFGDHQAPALSEEIQVEGLETIDVAQQREKEAPEVIVPEDISLDDLLGDQEKISALPDIEKLGPESVAAAAPPGPEQSAAAITSLGAARSGVEFDETPRIKPEVEKPPLTPTRPETPPILEEIAEPTPPIEAPAAPVAELRAADNIVYEQNFDSETDGESPRNWKGKYDYASLIVTSESPAPGSARCLKFEKKNGSGSAYYSCHFVDVSGRVGVEFDLRCDDKNKYLLGFYIEKDEDFRQSIHTIVHRTDSKATPTLRVQGEQTPYALGTWRHIRYEIDLNEGRVNGCVDGEMVADNVKLASSPSSINTLSIRDNLATTGVLFLDNIVIYRIR